MPDWIPVIVNSLWFQAGLFLLFLIGVLGLSYKTCQSIVGELKQTHKNKIKDLRQELDNIREDHYQDPDARDERGSLFLSRLLHRGQRFKQQQEAGKEPPLERLKEWDNEVIKVLTLYWDPKLLKIYKLNTINLPPTEIGKRLKEIEDKLYFAYSCFD